MALLVHQKTNILADVIQLQKDLLISRAVEKGRQRRSWPVVVLTYFVYAPRANDLAALLDEPF